MGYFGRHWRGELSLAVSFWVNVVVINLILRGLEFGFGTAALIANPVTVSQIIVFYTVAKIFLLYPWQVVGVWRCANRRARETSNRFWGRTVQAVIVFGFLTGFGSIANDWPVYRNLFKLAFQKDDFGEYQVTLLDDRQLIHLQGALVLGVSNAVQDILESNSDIKGIILDSAGGRIYEGRELAKLITEYNLITYSLKGCYSACGTAFISGYRRYLARGANLAFHQYTTGLTGADRYTDLSVEQGKDRQIFESQGVAKEFIDRLFHAENDDMWYPRIEELLVSEVIHGIVQPSDLAPQELKDFSMTQIEDELLDYPVFQIIKQNEPETYNKLMSDLEGGYSRGASDLEVQIIASKAIETLAQESLAVTSDGALVQFAGQVIVILYTLERKDPILCVKYLYPEQYGPINFQDHVSGDLIVSLLETLHRIIIDKYVDVPPKLDIDAAEKLIAEISVEMGDQTQFLVSEGLENTSDYSRACMAVVRYYELIYAEDHAAAANALRYSFSQ